MNSDERLFLLGHLDKAEEHAKYLTSEVARLREAKKQTTVKTHARSAANAALSHAEFDLAICTAIVDGRYDLRPPPKPYDICEPGSSCATTWPVVFGGSTSDRAINFDRSFPGSMIGKGFAMIQGFYSQEPFGLDKRMGRTSR